MGANGAYKLSYCDIKNLVFKLHKGFIVLIETILRSTPYNVSLQLALSTLGRALQKNEKRKFKIINVGSLVSS